METQARGGHLSQSKAAERADPPGGHHWPGKMRGTLGLQHASRPAFCQEGLLLLTALLLAALLAQSLWAGGPAPLRLFQSSSNGRPPRIGPPQPSAASKNLPMCNATALSGVLSNRSVAWEGWTTTHLTPPTGPWRLFMQRAELSLKHCSLRRFSPEEARQCLAGQHLVFLGDSVTRYEFLSFIHFLEFGKYPTPRWGLKGGRGRGSPVIEREWGSWQSYFTGTTRMFNGRHQCDCARDDTDYPNFIENRFYTGPRGISASYYFFKAPPTPIPGHWGFPPFSNTSACKVATCNRVPDWQLLLEQLLPVMRDRMAPNIILVNWGHWREPLLTPEEYDRLFVALVDAVQPQGGQVIWKTTTALLEQEARNEHDDPPLQAALRQGLPVLDAWQLTQPASWLQPHGFWDHMHPFGYVLAEINNYLLNMLC